MVTAYDFTMARLLDEAGVDIMPGGRFAGHGGAGARQHAPGDSRRDLLPRPRGPRALARAHLVGDMPFMSFQVSPEQAVESAGKMMKEGAFESVKIEGGIEVAEHVAQDGLAWASRSWDTSGSHLSACTRSAGSASRERPARPPNDRCRRARARAGRRLRAGPRGDARRSGLAGHASA